MKRVLATLATIVVLVPSAFVMIGADFRPEPVIPEPVKKHCIGYTIIEAGLGVDCHGDTVKLVRKHGYFEIAGN